MLRSLLLGLAKSKPLQRFVARNPFARHAARRFVAGETLQDAMAAVAALGARGLLATLDHLGEAVTTDQEADCATADYLALLDAIRGGGGVAEANVSLKLTQLGLDLSPDRCRQRLETILDRAAAHDNFVRIDMEDSSHTQATLDLFRSLFKARRNAGVVIQAYLHRSAEDVAALNALGARVRLCKGAYHEPAAVAFPRKADVDANFRRLAEDLLRDGASPAMATHDEGLIRWIAEWAKAHDIPPTAYEFQMLYGVRRDLQDRLARDGHAVRVYVPYGSQWFPYFMRRLAERPANLLFFLTQLGRR